MSETLTAFVGKGARELRDDLIILDDAGLGSRVAWADEPGGGLRLTLVLESSVVAALVESYGSLDAARDHVLTVIVEDVQHQAAMIRAGAPPMPEGD